MLLAHTSSCGIPADTSFSGQAPATVAPKRRHGAPRRRKGWRTPGRFADFRNHRVARSVMDCGGPPPLSPEACQTVPRLTGTAILAKTQRGRVQSAAVPLALHGLGTAPALHFVFLLHALWWRFVEPVAWPDLRAGNGSWRRPRRCSPRFFFWFPAPR